MSSENKSQASDQPDTEKADTIVKLKPSAKSKSTAVTNDLNKRFSDLESQIIGINDELEGRKAELQKITRSNTSSKTQVTKKINETIAQLKELDGNYYNLLESITGLSAKAAGISEQASQTSSAQQQLKTDLQGRADQLDDQIKSLELRASEIMEELDRSTTALEATIHEVQKSLDSQAAEHRTEIQATDTKISEELDRTTTALEAVIHEVQKSLDSQATELGTDIRAIDQKISEELDRTTIALESTIYEVQKSLDYQTAELNEDIKAADKKIRQHEQRLDQHKATDDALDERTSSLENTTGRIDEQTLKLEGVANKLGQQSQQLLDAVSGLNNKTGELQATTETQGAQISKLDQREIGHFRLLGTGLVILAMLGGAAYVYEKGLWQSDSLQNQALQQQLLEQKTALSANAEHQAALQQELNELRQLLSESQQQSSMNIEQEKVVMQQQIETLEDRLKGMNDGVETLDGRLVAMNPNLQFGGDNIIHGAHWLTSQNPKQFSLELTSFSNKQDMYKTAQRYSYYLKEKLAWYSTGSADNTRYVLVYGQFSDHSSALAVKRKLPLRQARVVRMSEIQSKL